MIRFQKVARGSKRPMTPDIKHDTIELNVLTINGPKNNFWYGQINVFRTVDIFIDFC